MKYQARQTGYEVLGRLRPDEVLPYTGATAPKEIFFGHAVKMTSLRYQTFVKNDCKCVCCGIIGTVMLLEMPSNGGKVCLPHFNLYAKREGVLIQMTKDHIQPKSKGGVDHIANMQTMCHVCNELKGNRRIKGGNERTLQGLRKIQDGVQVVYTVLYLDNYPMQGFATTPEGIIEILTRYITETHNWSRDSFEILVDMEKEIATLQSETGEDTTFDIQPVRRI
jgi:hypothetical protein